MLIAASSALLFAKSHSGSASSDSQPKSDEVRFTGEVQNGKLFEHGIGHGLVFRLTPVPDDPQTGWDINIVARDAAASGTDKNLAFITPPYHFFNPCYIETAYGYTAKQIVAMSTREFYFVASAAGYQPAMDALNLVVYPNNASAEEINRASRSAAKIPAGKGEFRIVDSRISSGATKDDPGKIEWLKFDVRLDFPPGLNVSQVLPGQ